MLLLARLLKAGDLIDFISLATLTGIKIGVGLADRGGHLRRLGGAGPEMILRRAGDHGRGLKDARDQHRHREHQE